MKQKILLVEDEKILQKNYQTILEQNGYEVYAFDNTQDAIESFDKEIPNLAILDIMLGADLEGGFKVFKALRDKSTTVPIIFMTALNSDYRKILALESGAWDYLTKDISLKLFVAKVNSIFSMLSNAKPIEDESDGTNKIRLDIKCWQAIYNEKRINFTLTEFSILEELVRNSNKTVSYSTMEKLTHQKVVTINTLATHIRQIRIKFKEIDEDFDCLKSVHKLGYVWKC